MRQAELEKYLVEIEAIAPRMPHISIGMSPASPWITRYAWVGRDSRLWPPVEFPEDGDRLYLAVRNLGLASVRVEFSLRSETGKIIFADAKQKGYQAILIVPPTHAYMSA